MSLNRRLGGLSSNFGVVVPSVGQRPGRGYVLSSCILPLSDVDLTHGLLEALERERLAIAQRIADTSNKRGPPPSSPCDEKSAKRPRLAEEGIGGYDELGARVEEVRVRVLTKNNIPVPKPLNECELYCFLLLARRSSESLLIVIPSYVFRLLHQCTGRREDCSCRDRSARTRREGASRGRALDGAHGEARR